MFVKQHRLPFEPLHKVFNYEITIQDLAKVIKVTDDTVWNWKKHGVPEPQADKVAVRLGLHPASIWGDAWWSLEHLPPLRDGGTSTDTTTPACA